jgi:hypothetical protein
MTVIQHRRPAVSGLGSHARRALGRSAHALRSLYDEQVYAWECFFRAGLPRQARPQDPAANPAGPQRRVHVPPPRPAPDR